MRLRASGDQSSTDRAAARAARWGWAALLVCTLASPTAAALPDGAGARAVEIRGRIFDAAHGPSAGIAGARVELEFVGVKPGAVVYTDDAGTFAASFEVTDDDWLVVSVSAEGFYPVDSGLDYRGSVLRDTVTINYGLEARADVEIHGHVFDAAAGAAVPVVGARVFFWQNDVPSTLTTDAAGAFTFILALPDNETFALWGSAEGYFTRLLTSEVAPLRRSGRIEVALQAAPARVTTVVSGLVYDVSIGPDAPIAGAQVAYDYHGDAYPDVSDVVLTDGDGRYRIELPFGPNDALALSVQADGYGTLRYGTGASERATGAPIDFGLPPLGGVARVEPDQVSFVCGDRFTITVTNVGQPGETLTIVDFQFGFAYSQGVYGQNFAWDIDQIEFPLVLAPGEQVAFPVSFDPGGFASRLYFNVISGSREAAYGTYYGGRDADCGCRGDCDADGDVSIGELVRAVSLALGGDAALCPMLDVDGDGEIAVTEVLTAVGNALRGCAG